MARIAWLNHGGMYVKGTYGKQHVERTELSVVSYVLRWLQGHLRHRFQLLFSSDKVTWRLSSQPLYLQVSNRIDFTKTSSVQTELSFELSTLCIQPFTVDYGESLDFFLYLRVAEFIPPPHPI